MTDFTLHTLETASEAAKPLVENAISAFGMLPNLIAVMAEAPALLKAYQEMHAHFQSTSFNAEELTVVWQTINVEHECHYCVPAHTMIAQMMEVDTSITASIKAGEPLANAKLEALRATTLVLVRERGRISEAQKDAFFSAGYERKQLLEIVVGIAQKVMSNYTNHIADTPLDDAFAQFA
ncbi:MAG: carboxymuconolactone decarboxylase [Alteromonadaceae bacterium]|nr:MAG: carboxymuconolactone decarboxylase [Alteromonadaceae bacterium]